MTHQNDECTGCRWRGAWNCADKCSRKWLDRHDHIPEGDDGISCTGCSHEGKGHGSCGRCARHYKDYFEYPKPQTPEEKKRADSAMVTLAAAMALTAGSPYRR